MGPVEEQQEQFEELRRDLAQANTDLVAHNINLQFTMDHGGNTRGHSLVVGRALVWGSSCNPDSKQDVLYGVCYLQGKVGVRP